MQIHPTAVVDPEAKLGEDCVVGPGAVIEADVVIGNRCRIGPHAFVGRYTTMGDDNHLHIGAVVGYIPQDLKFRDGMVTHCIVGNGNHFREYCVVHRSAREGEATRIGDRNYLMNHSHVGHDVQIGDQVILGASALLAGFVEVGDRAYFSGNTAVHQFCRIGRIGMLRGVSGISMHVPPFCVADWHNHLKGLNLEGMKRAGIEIGARKAVKAAFRMLFRGGDPLSDAIRNVEASEHGDVAEVVELLDFCKSALVSGRGIVSWHRGTQPEGDGEAARPTAETTSELLH